MDMVDLLINARKAVEAAELPVDLRPVGFRRVLELLSRTGALAAEGGARRTDGSDAEKTAGSATEKLAAKLEIDLHTVEEVFSVDSEGRLEVIIGRGKLSAASATAARQVAILVAGSRQISGSEEWTEIGAIRDVCQHYGKFDQANFASTIKKMDDVFGFRGSGSSRQLRINRAGADELKSLVVSLTGGKV